MRRCVAAAATVVALATAVGCSRGGDGGNTGHRPVGLPETTTEVSPTSTSTAAPASVPLADVRVRLTKVADIPSPTAMATRAGDDALYVTQQRGVVSAVRGGRVETVLDLQGEVRSGGEQGLLGIAFSPDGATMYLDYTDRAGDTHVEAVDLATKARRQLLFVKQPYANHNGGQLAVRPDGMLWIALGDGGSGGDPHGNGQNLGVLLGKILRIDPSPQPGGRPYGIPRDNPFVGRSGARPEIWDYGLRNPWRFSFDRETGDLWIADVGQNAWEEVDFEPAGEGGRNYGWNAMEGTHPYDGGSPPPGAVPPILEYSHRSGGVAVTGGYVYRGAKIPALRGAYLYGDFAAGRVLAVRQQGGRIVDRAALDASTSSLSSFGEDGSGEVYVLSLAAAIYRLDPA